MKRCDRCKFWIKMNEKTEDADCRRHSGVPFPRTAINPISQQQGVIVLCYWPRMSGHLWCGDYRRKAWLIPWCQRLIARAILFCYGGEECLTKEEPENMPKGENLKDISMAVSQKRKPSLN